MGKFTLEEVNDMYIDVLREIGNIGSGNATTAIASLLGVKLDMKVPKVQLMDAADLGGSICPEDEVIVGILLGVSEDIDGSMMFLLKMDCAHHLVNRMMMRDPNYSEPFDEMDLSALQEVGNIIAGSYLNALATLTNMKIVPTVPYLSVDMAASILSVPAIQFGIMGDNALMIETEFGDDSMINGYFILMPEADSYDKILRALGLPV
ncbi:MAG: chemotaxis protein CheC [Lachnospiraceae bacterium]|nr:chemotaxis protein CheC [Lachnospiraceae bacterium]